MGKIAGHCMASRYAITQLCQKFLPLICDVGEYLGPAPINLLIFLETNGTLALPAAIAM
jgi:hypothetical protein